MKLSKQFRDAARDALRGRWLSAIITSIVAGVLGGVLFDFKLSLDYSLLFKVIKHLYEGTPMKEDVSRHLLISLPFILFATMFTLIVGSTVKVGHARFYLRIVDRKLTWIGALFTYYRQWVTAFLTELLKSIFIFLWSLLLIVPGIIAYLNYSMTPFIIAEDPTITPTEAMKRSKQLMNGNKLRLVRLHLSFIGWAVLSVLRPGL